MDRVTKPQKKMLITLLRETKFMEGKKEKEWYWEKIQAALNTIGPKKTIIQWKKCWRDMRLTTRKKLAELKRCQLAGGSPPPGIELNQEDNDIIDIVGTEYFYEEMNGEIKPENFITGFEYVPEHFCDAILTASAGHQTQNMQPQHQKNHSSTQQSSDLHNNDGETSDATDSHGVSFQTVASAVSIQGHNGDASAAQPTQQHSNNFSQHHPVFHGALHPHLLRRQHTTAFQRESVFEEKLLQLMQDAFPKKKRKRKNKDPDKLFLLSLYEEMKRVPEDIRLDVKTELINVLKKYQSTSEKYEKIQNHSATSISNSKLHTSTDKTQLLSSNCSLSHSMYRLQKNYEKNEKESSPQSQNDRLQHSRDTSTTSVLSSQIPLFNLPKKFEDGVSEKVHDQRKNEPHSQHAAHQPTRSSTNEQHLHHPHNIMFPISTQIRDQINSHHPQNHQQQHQLPHQQQTVHHSATIFGTPSGANSIADRPTMPYESVG